MTSATSDAATTTGPRHSNHRRATARGVPALMYACQQGDAHRVRRIISEQPSALLARDRTGKTPLHYCCTSDSICAAHAADLLVMAAPDLMEGRDEDGFTPLHLAVIAGNMPLVTFLLANKADVNAVDNEKHTVVHWATVCGETAALRAVLAAGAPVSTPDVHGGYPLHYAAQMCGGDKDSNLGLQVLQALLGHSDIVVSVEDGDGRQPLLWAASAGSAKAVLALVRAGAAVEAPDKDGLTALHCAASRGHTDCIDSLLTLCGASPDVIDSNGCTALHYAVTLGHADATALLLAHGADPNRQDRKGRSPAHCGCAKGQLETVKMIGAHGANLWLRNARGDLPLHEAAASGRRDLVRWLLDMRPSQVNARNNDGRCPLHLAALNDNVDMCKILLDAGAQINPILRTSKNTFMTPLDCALQRGFRSTAKYLQLHGGVPANRLGDVRHRQQNAGVNLQIKDDVTFWGDTSSDSERENGETVKYSKRVQRKKISSKYEKKRASLSGSDLENNKFIGGKLESGRSKRRLSEKNQRVRTAGRGDSAAGAIDQPKRGYRKTPSGRFDYTNEIIINGKTEINIHQTKEITVGGAEEEILTKATNNSSKEIEEKVISELPVEKDKRPKSAKHAKLKDKTAKSSEKDENSKRKARPSSKTVQRQQTTQEQPKQEVDIVVTKSTDENKNVKTPDKNITEEKMMKQKKLPDQQSLRSNTSEEVEEPKSVVVEAAIHEPPKSEQPDAKSQVAEDKTTKEIDIQTDMSIAVDTVIGEDILKETMNNKNIEETPEPQAQEAQQSAPKASHNDEVIRELAESQKQPEESQMEQSIVEESSPHVEEKLQDEGNELTSSELAKDELAVLETEGKVEPTSEISQTEDTIAIAENEKAEAIEEVSTHVSPETKEIITEEITDKQTDEKAAFENKDEVDKSEDVQETNDQKTKTENDEEAASALTEEIQKEVKEETEEIQVVEKVSEENQESGTEKVIEVTNKETAKTTSEETENQVKAVDVEITQIEKVPAGEATQQLDGEEENVEKKSEISKDEEIQSNKSKKKTRRKRRDQSKNEEDQAYEIIYKTIGAGETEDEENDVAEELEKTKTSKRHSKDKIKAKISTSESKSSEEDYLSDTQTDSSSTTLTVKEHKSFRILDEQEANEIEKTKTKPRKATRKSRSPPKRQRSRSEENKKDTRARETDKLKKSKIPSSSKSHLLQSEKYLNVPERKTKSSMESRVPSLPDINESKDHLKEYPRSESNMSAPLLASVSDDERVSGSDVEPEEKSSESRKKKVKRKPKTREARSAGSDYESSNVIDSGFEPSPRSSRIPKWKNMSERGVNMSSVTQSIQANIRRYHLERKIFQHLLDLKRMQIRAGQHNEAILVKRAIDAYHQSCASTVGAGRYVPEDYTFKSFEKFLYLSLRKLQRNGADHLKGLPEPPANPLLCTQSTHRCMHATHAYTGIPCAAYLPKMDHHTIPKIGFASTQCKPGTGFLPTINPKKAVTLELCHGNDKQIISLPADRLDQNKRYYVTFTVKGNENSEEAVTSGHRHSKSD